MSTVTNANDPLRPTPVQPNYPSLYEYSHSAESRRPTPINCLVHHLYRAALGCQISLWGSVVPVPLSLASKNYSKMGTLFFLSMDCLVSLIVWFHCLATGRLHMSALSVFRSCGGTTNRVHDTGYAAFHVLFLECLSSRSSPHYHVPSFITLEPMNIGKCLTSRMRKSCRNIRQTSPPCHHFCMVR
jgi:hypothetical protein